MSREAPEPWASWMRQAGFVDPNVKTVRASMRQLAATAQVHTSTVAAMMFGDRAPKHATITAVAEALGVDVRTVAEQAGQTRTEREPYAMPDEVHLLSGRVQVAITQLIRAIAEEREHGGDTAAKSEAEETSAQDAANDMAARERA
ncbi:MAG TPA: helix-turn-helix transcriptional regulator, partial [Coriobacteriia bacterium]|nr:helix-turn-helix transcriptional regulator [Coriobacteriia bacterium]